MKILMVSMNSIHFRRWTSQLEDSGHEVFWFDALGAEGTIKELSWVTQKTDWRLRIKKGRYWIKKIPFLKRLNERPIEKAFETYLKEVQPDVVNSFAIQIGVIPILNVMKQYRNIKWVGSTWGSDVYYFEELGIRKDQLCDAVKHLHYLFTDCARDATILKEFGFEGVHLGVFPGNGGIEFSIPLANLKSPHERNRIFIKAYNDNIGQGEIIIKAIVDLPAHLFKDYVLVFLGTSDEDIENLKAAKNDELKMEIYPRNIPIKNSQVLEILTDSYIYIGNSLSDGIPNLLLEAMGNGAFPIQSNPGGVTSEIIEDRKNGLLIEDQLDVENIKSLLTGALLDTKMVENCFEKNITEIRSRCNRKNLKRKIEEAYKQMV